MRRTLIFIVTGALALIAAVAAIAVTTATGITATTATFDATKGNVETRTCTGADNKAYELTRGSYTGTVAFTNPSTGLNGPLTINARTVFSTSDGLGYVDGTFRVKDGDSRVVGRFSGTLDKDRNVVGFFEGSSWGNHARVLGNLSAALGTGSFVGGKIGAGGSTAIAAVVAGPVCRGAKADHKSDNKPEHPARPLSIKGEVTALGSAPTPSITVRWHGPATVTCNLDATSPSTALFPVGTKVEMKCEKVGTDWILRELKTHT